MVIILGLSPGFWQLTITAGNGISAVIGSNIFLAIYLISEKYMFIKKVNE